MTRLELAQQLETHAARVFREPADRMLHLMAAEMLRQADEKIVDLTCELREAYDR